MSDFLIGEEHVKRYQETDGAEGFEWREGSHILLLTTVGRKSGRESTTPLIFGMDGDNPVIVASKGGAPKHPGWYRNLVKNPAAHVQIKGEKFPVRARDAEGGARPAVEDDERRVAPLRRVPGEDRPRDSRGRPGTGLTQDRNRVACNPVADLLVGDDGVAQRRDPLDAYLDHVARLERDLRVARVADA